MAALRLGGPDLEGTLAGQGTRPQAASGGGTTEERQNRVSLTVNLTVSWPYTWSLLEEIGFHLSYYLPRLRYSPSFTVWSFPLGS